MQKSRRQKSRRPMEVSFQTGGEERPQEGGI